mgnify:CR=1 FL=1
MIVRDVRIRYRDSTIDTLQDYTNQRLILAPLLDFEIEVVERVCVVVEPLTGTLDSPDPNGFVSVVPASWAAGNTFAITLLSQDWEQEGFALGDEVFLLIKGGSFYLAVHARIRQISANNASFDIIAVFTGALPNFQNPVEVVCLLLDDAPALSPALHHGGGSGLTSPLSGLPFTTPHADAFQVTNASTNNLPTMLYNLQKYATYEASVDSAFPALHPRRFREYTYTIKATQFYAYRTNLDPTAQVPTGLYNLSGRIDFEVRKRNVQRDLSVSFDCLLLHPNRLEDTLNFLPAGTLTISGSSATLTPPAGFTPQRSRVALLGSDAHHAQLTIADSVALTAPTQPPTLPPPRAGADYVGVMVGLSAGKWVAVMTNKEPSTTPAGGVFYAYPLHPSTILFRYDFIIAELAPFIATAGIYTIQTLLKHNNNFVVIDEVSYDTANTVSSPYPPFSADFFAKTLLYPLQILNATFGLNRFEVSNYDFFYKAQLALLFRVPLPSRRQPPVIPFALAQPSGGYGYDLQTWGGGQVTLKWRVFTPAGDVYDSNELAINTFQPDAQQATITETATQIIINRPANTPPADGIWHTALRVAVLKRPEDYVPVIEKIFYIQEDYDTNSVLLVFTEGSSAITITRVPFVDFSGYQVIINKTALPAGDYTVHMRHSVRRQNGINNWSPADDESYFYDFSIPAPAQPQPPALPASGLCLPRTPAISGESWDYIFLQNNSYQHVSTTLTTCSLANYCTCFELVSEIPKTFIDLTGHFRGSVQGRPVPPNAKHKARFIGWIKRIADETETESFVSSAYKKEDIIRSFSERFELDLLILTPCDLSHLDLLKYAERVDIVNRNNQLLPAELKDLVITEIDLQNETQYLRARVSLRTLAWRSEYRRQG